MSKSAAINMRAEPKQQALLTKAASVLNIKRSSFILDVACREAEQVLLDQRLFLLDDKAFRAFDKAINAPIPESKKLKQLLSKASPWE